MSYWFIIISLIIVSATLLKVSSTDIGEVLSYISIAICSCACLIFKDTVLLGCLLIAVIIIRFSIEPFVLKYSRVYRDKELGALNQERIQLYTRLLTMENQIVSLDKLVNQLRYEKQVAYGSVSSTCEYLVNEINSNHPDLVKLARLCASLSEAYRKPVVVYQEKPPNIFNALTSPADRKRGLKILKEFKQDYYFGEGFDIELDSLINLLERSVANDFSRTDQNRK